MKITWKSVIVTSLIVFMLSLLGFYYAAKNWLIPDTLQARLYLLFRTAPLTELALEIIENDYRAVNWAMGERFPIGINGRLDERELADSRPECPNLPEDNYFVVRDQNESLSILSCTQSELLIRLITEAGGESFSAGQVNGSVSIQFGSEGEGQVYGDIYLVFRPLHQEITYCEHENHVDDFGECLIGRRNDWYIVWKWFRYPVYTPKELLEYIHSDDQNETI